jgi:uncharacterized protein YbgA (DUF1722 family)
MWYNRIVNDLAEIPSAVDYYNAELAGARDETKIIGNLEKNSQELSGITSYRFGQLQEIEAILKHLNILYDKMRSEHYRRYLERYQRDLSDRSIEKYIDGEENIVGMLTLINEVSLIRNKYLALMKGLDIKAWQIGHIVKLRVVGMEDVNLGTKGG